MPKATLLVSADAATLLAGVGEQLRAARKCRQLTVEATAAQLNTTSARIRRAESGDPTVAIGLYAMLLCTYGLGEDLRTLAAPSRDPVVKALTKALRGRAVEGSGNGS